MKATRGGIGFLGAIFFLGSAGFAYSATFNVANGDVAGLKAAITTANSNGQDDTIVLAPNGTYNLTTRDNGLNGLPQIGPDGGHSITIQGNGAQIMRSTATGTPNFRLLYIQAGANVTIQGFLEFVNGNPGAFHGGAIYVDGELGDVTLTLIDAQIHGCSADYGGAIFNDGYQDPSVPPHTATLNLIGTGIQNNTASLYGGAVWNQSGGIVFNATNVTFFNNMAVHDAGAVQFDGSNGTATGSITNCDFAHNSAGSLGGAIRIDGISGSAALSIKGCTFDQNSATTGGAIYSNGGSGGNAVVNILNCTFSGNSATNGGAISNDGSSGNAIVKVDSCTFKGNSATTSGDALYVSQTGSGTTAAQIANSIVASGNPNFNLAVANASGGTAAISSQGYNLSDDDAGGGAGTGPGGFLNHSGDIRNTDPLLDPSGLKDNGGPYSNATTIALRATSPAIDQGKKGILLASSNDQRGEFRPFDDPNIANASGGDGSDIGAYEADVRIIMVIQAGANLQLQFLSILGHTYEVQGQTGLSPANWTTVNNTTPAPPISGTGGIVLVTVPNAVGGAPVGFYRVHQLP